MDSLMSWMATQGFLPHGYCFQWDPSILTLMVLSDLATMLAYYSIPLALLALVDYRKQDIRFKWMFFLFACFIFFCGTTHLMDIITIWYPTYYLQAVIKALAGAASVGTAILLWPLVRKLKTLPLVQPGEKEVNFSKAAGKAEAAGPERET